MTILNMVYYTVDSGWKPGANTLIYYPFTSDLVDQMGNGDTGTMTGTCTFSNTTGIHATGRSGNYVTGLSNGIANRNTFTLNVWVKALTNQMVAVGYANTGTTNQAFCVYRRDALEVFCIPQGSSQSSTSYKITAGDGWHNYCITADGSVYKTYIDGVNGTTYSNSSNVNNVSEMQIGWGGYYGSSRGGECYVKDYIVETVARTAQEVADYYNLTKSNYGL